MNLLEKYTIIDLINKFKNVIGDGIEDFLCQVIGSPNSIRNLKEMIDGEVEDYFQFIPKSKVDIESARKIRIAKTYELAYQIFEGNNDEETKMQFLSELYMIYSEKLNSSQKKN